MVHFRAFSLATVACGAWAGPDKNAAINKVITMLEDLQAQILAEGEKEVASYNKFACWCKETTDEKNEAIAKGQDSQQSLVASIGGLNTKRDDLDQTILNLEGDIEAAENDMKNAKATRDSELKLYEKNEADLSGALAALDGAIDALKTSKKPSLLQLRSLAETVKTASTLADVLGFATAASQRSIAMFLQQDPSVPMEDFKFHSTSVIDTLEELKGNFRTQKQDLDADEVQTVSQHDLYMQEKNDLVRAKQTEMNQKKEERETTVGNIATDSAELSTVSADLLADKDYMAQTARMCEDTAKTWDSRSQVRADELSALTAATAVVKDSVKGATSENTVRLAQMGTRVQAVNALVHNERYMEAVEADAQEADGESSPVGFLQRKARVSPHKFEDGRQFVVNMLRSQGARIKSSLLLGLATKISADPFAKIKKLIQDLIERLLQEAANEANQKGWCDKATADAERTRDESAAKVAEINAALAEDEAHRDKLNEEIGVLEAEILELETARNESSDIRNQTSTENIATIQEAEGGLVAVNSAIDIIDKFYKTAAKTSVGLSLAQQGPDAPSAGFDIGEEYTGAGGEAGGIVGMLDVIKGDFERTIDVTAKAEKSAEKEYKTFMTESSMSLAEKTMTLEQSTKYRDEAVTDLTSNDGAMIAASASLNGAITELIELKKTCVDTGMSYEERVARREDEIEALKKALCILSAYAEFGPDGLADAC